MRSTYSFATHTYERKNIQKCKCLFPDNAAACKAENGKLENLSYVTKIEQMMGFWRAMNQPELMVSFKCASCNMLAKYFTVTPGLVKTKEGLLTLRTWPAHWCCSTYSGDKNMTNNLTTLMHLNMRLTIVL